MFINHVITSSIPQLPIVLPLRVAVKPIRNSFRNLQSLPQSEILPAIKSPPPTPSPPSLSPGDIGRTSALAERDTREVNQSFPAHRSVVVVVVMDVSFT